MNKTALVNILHSRTDLLHYFAGIGFWYPIIFINFSKEGATGTQFCDYMYMLLILKNFVYFEQIWMIKVLQDVDFIR